mmetsp:Transcript_38843/g.122403  ORF Transcript_38843/g.122403 Transcript_38843/m.122403 type:complete len:232 (+) Transcript_38843:420-1115(+)
MHRANRPPHVDKGEAPPTAQRLLDERRVHHRRVRPKQRPQRVVEARRLAEEAQAPRRALGRVIAVHQACGALHGVAAAELMASGAARLASHVVIEAPHERGACHALEQRLALAIVRVHDGLLVVVVNVLRLGVGHHLEAAAVEGEPRVAPAVFDDELLVPLCAVQRVVRAARVAFGPDLLDVLGLIVQEGGYRIVRPLRRRRQHAERRPGLRLGRGGGGGRAAGNWSRSHL